MKSTGFTWRKFSRKLARNWGGRKRNVWINPHSACQAPCKALHGRTLVLRWDLQVELSIQCPHFPHTLRILGFACWSSRSSQRETWDLAFLPWAPFCACTPSFTPIYHVYLSSVPPGTQATWEQDHSFFVFIFLLPLLRIHAMLCTLTLNKHIWNL